MKKLFAVITVLITLSLVGIILIQYSWLKNIIMLKQEQIRGQINMAEYEILDFLLDVKSETNTNIPSDMLPSNPSPELLKMLGKKTIAESVTLKEVQDRLREAFASNGLKDAKFQFAILATSNNDGPDLATPEYMSAYENALVDTANNIIDVWPLLTVEESEEGIVSPREKLVVILTNSKAYLYRSILGMVIAAALFSLIIITAFYLTIRTILTQKKLSEMKTDFINNMTHELRTPLATISIAVDTLKNEKVIGDRDKLAAIGNIIKTENIRMNTQVEQILQAAQLDVNQVLKDKVPLNVHEVMGRIYDKFSLQLEEKNAVLEMHLDAEKDDVSGHAVHFVNMLSNLVDNALKYSKEDVSPHIIVKTFNQKKNIVLTVEDNGIGMSKDTMSKIFDKFYRAHTGNIHDVKGFGLGLNYTRKMVEAHLGTISVESTIGKGSRFTVTLPLS